MCPHLHDSAALKCPLLAKEIGIDHALASRSLYTDGAELLFDYVQHASGEEAKAAGELVVVRNGRPVALTVHLR